MSFRKGVAVVAPVVSCHCYNKDGSMCALSPNTKDVLIYKTNGNGDYAKWKLVYTLQEHDQKVTCIDWGKNNNKILTCSEDRNAYVWSLVENGKRWKPTLVLVRINRAALCCQWSANEDKFAVGSGAKCISVCFFGKEQNWWVSNIVKKRFRSSVTSICWHPVDNTLLAAGSTDGHCRIISTFLKKLDDSSLKKGAFGKVLMDFDAGSWVHGVTWSDSGDRLAFVSHNSTVWVANQGDEEAYMIRSKYLPFKTVKFAGEDKIICSGWNYSPIVYSLGGNGWEETGNLDAKKSGAGGGRQNSNTRSAFSKFQKRTVTGGRGSTVVASKHKNTVNDIQVFKNKLSTSGIDGRIFHWTV